MLFKIVLDEGGKALLKRVPRRSRTFVSVPPRVAHKPELKYELERIWNDTKVRCAGTFVCWHSDPNGFPELNNILYYSPGRKQRYEQSMRSRQAARIRQQQLRR